MMAVLYLGPGLLANVALMLNLVLLVGVLAFFSAVLTLPGIAALVLTVGMAVDANILVFERIKEEKAKGRTIAQAVETGYDRALVTIIDANLTTLITAYFLFQLGSGPVRGFGITLAIGILVSMFTALYVTRTLFTWLMQKGAISEAKMRGQFHPPTIDWMGMKRRVVTGSAIAMVLGAIAWEAVPEARKYDLDFSEGSRLVVRFSAETSKDDVEAKIDALARANPEYSDVTVRVSAEGIGAAVAADSGRIFEIRSQEISTQAEIEAFEKSLLAAFKGDLVPGPFRATLRNDGQGNTTGEVTFVNDTAKAVWLTEAFDAHSREFGVLREAKVEPITENVPGAKSAFKVTFSDDPESARDIDLAVGKALQSFDTKRANASLTWLEEQAEGGGSTDEDKEKKAALAARAAALKANPFPEDSAGIFKMTDPLPSADRVDPFTARQHRDAAIRAVALSILGIILYVAFRFRSWAFGFAAVVALVHDVLVVLGLIALINWTGIVDARLNLVTVAAFLTLIGYSINDTIVVFDRIRENRGTGRTRLASILNNSINQTLSRTIRTTSTTWIVVAILFAMNLGSGSPLEGFAFILMIGVLVGTYSSIFIASPTLIYLPWLWEKSGGTAKSFAKRVIPYAVVSLVLLLLVDWRQGNLTGDWSKVGFADLLLSIPMGTLLLFLLQFVAFTRADDADTAVAASA
jgi:SecD/SecF fusion protein